MRSVVKTDMKKVLDVVGNWEIHLFCKTPVHYFLLFQLILQVFFLTEEHLRFLTYLAVFNLSGTFAFLAASLDALIILV